MMNETKPLTSAIEAGIISFKNLQGDYFLKFATKSSTHSRTKNHAISIDTLEAFEMELKKLILEICNPDTKFIEKEVKQF